MSDSGSETKTSQRAAMDSELQRNFEQFDSLIQILNTDMGSLAQEKKPVVEYTIRPKRDADIMEELQVVNKNLRLLVAKVIYLQSIFSDVTERLNWISFLTSWWRS